MQSNETNEYEIDKLHLAANFRSGQIDNIELTYLLSHITQHIRRSHNSLFSEADDLASETVLKAFESIEGPKDNAHFFAWVRGIARHVALHRIAELTQMPLQSRDAAFGTINDETPEEVQALQEQAGFDDDALLRTMVLKEARGALSDEQRAVIALRIDEQHASKEVAEMLGLKAPNVRQIEVRACQKMHEFLTKNGYADLFRAGTRPCRQPAKPTPTVSAASLSAGA